MPTSSLEWSRREFLRSGAVVPLAGLTPWQTAPTGLTAGQVIDRIKANVGIPWRAQTVDNIVAGAADTPVRGIATTMMATLDVVQRAFAAGRNMVITHESTFFSHQDAIESFKNDPTYQFKRDFLNKNQMVVFHFHDHWHGRQPDGIATGMTRELGWEKNADAANPRQFRFDNVTLADLAKEMQAKLKIRVMRVVGDPKLRVNRVAASWGFVSPNPGMGLFAQPDVDVLVIGEAREWEVVEYAQDTIESGKKKALIVLGHVVSEQAGMKYCAEWLRPLVTEVPVEFIAADEPYWSPNHPRAV
jgi:putative NIF3 family GTP cyclohydrolase 1 type 2